VSSSVGGSSNKHPDTDFGQPNIRNAKAISEIQTETGGIGHDLDPRGGVDMNEPNTTANSEPQELAEPQEAAQPQGAAEPQQVSEPQEAAEPQEASEPPEVAEAQEVAEPEAASPEENNSP
jgi:hypothetical protein